MAEITALTGLVQSLCLATERPLAFGEARCLTGMDFVQRARAWARSFAAAPGQRYALHHEDSFEFAAALFGAWHAGKIVYLPADTLAPTLQTLASEVDGFAGAFSDGLQAEPGPWLPEGTWGPLEPEVCRLVLYTSGSSGDPVAIGKNLRQLDSEIANLEHAFGALCANATIQGTVSHQHIYGLLFRVLWPLAAGRAFAAHRLAYPEQIAALSAAQACVLVSSPALLKRLPESLDWASTRSALQAVFSSGGPLPAEAGTLVRRLWEQSVIEVYGSTETGGIATRNSGQGTWRPLPGVEFRVDESALLVRSPHLADDDWYRTEDGARAVAEGFELLGRNDRLVKLEERRISLDAIERALKADELVDDARVLVLAGPRDRIVAVIVPSQASSTLQSGGRKQLIEHLRAILRPQVEAIALPKLWRFVEALPTNAQGKTTHRQLADLFHPVHPVPHWQQRSASAARLELTATGDMVVFDGHFPGTPILPGVAMVHWAITCGREAFGISQPFLRMEALKFQQLVRPDAPLQLELGWRAETSTLLYSYTSTQGPNASGRIVFGDKVEPA